MVSAAASLLALSACGAPHQRYCSPLTTSSNGQSASPQAFPRRAFVLSAYVGLMLRHTLMKGAVTNGQRWTENVEWLVDASGCDPQTLASTSILQALFDRAIVELDLHPVAPPHFHSFPGAAGVTGFALLSESHLSCHTFPETGFAAFDLFCCKDRPDWDWAERLKTALGARDVRIRKLMRGTAPAGT